MRRGGSQGQSRKKKTDTPLDSSYFLHRGINTVHRFLCTRDAVCMHVTTMHVIYEGLINQIQHSLYLHFIEKYLITNI